MKHDRILGIIILFWMPFIKFAQDFSSPEKTLKNYIHALQTGNKALVEKCYQLEGKAFNLPSSLDIQEYKIIPFMALWIGIPQIPPNSHCVFV